VKIASVQGGGGSGPAGARWGTSFSGGSAGGTSWNGEGGVVGGAVGGAGGGCDRPAGESTGSTGCTGVGDGVGEDVGSGGGESAGAESLSIAVGEAGHTGGNGAGWHSEMGDNCSSSSASLSRSGSASHLRLAAFHVRLASGEAIVAGEGTSGSVDIDGDGTVGRGAP
jgi:hypothetical protein